MDTVKLKNSEDLFIRIAQKADATKLIEYVKKVADETEFLTFNSQEFEITVEQEERILENYLRADNTIYLLAFMKDEIVGVLNLHASQRPRLKHVGEFGMSVLKKDWNKGVGAALMTHMISWAKEGNIIKKINLKVSVENYNAIQLYKKFGFFDEGRMARDLIINEVYQDTFLMGLLID